MGRMYCGEPLYQIWSGYDFPFLSYVNRNVTNAKIFTFLGWDKGSTIMDHLQNVTDSFLSPCGSLAKISSKSVRDFLCYAGHEQTNKETTMIL